MGTSTWRSLSPILELVMDLRPRPSRVLDVGLGSGKFGLLCREYLEQWDDLCESPARAVIDGIEAYEGYIGPLQRAIYDRIIVEEAGRALAGMPDDAYELVLLVDVIEHFDEESGRRVLAQCRRVGRVVILSTPSVFVRQLPKRGNALEEHRSFWPRRRLAREGADLVIKPDGENYIAVFGRPEHRARLRPAYRWLRACHRRLPFALQQLLAAESALVAPILRWMRR